MIGSRDDIRPGAWWAMCCIEDLYEIENEKEADDVRYYWDQGLLHGVWPTMNEALAAFNDCPPEELQAFLDRQANK